MSEVLAIEGVRRQVRELVDGTLEIKIQIEPRHKAAFLRLLPNIDMPVAIAPLALARPAEPMVEAPTESAPAVEPPVRVKGGELARLAGRLCNDPDFQDWIARQFGRANVDAAGAAGLVRAVCGIPSRACLDTDEKAASTFHEQIRKPFNAWSNGKESK